MTTIFAHLAKEVGDYRKTHMHLQRFFGIGRHPIDLIKLDYISMFMWTDDLNLHDLTKILYINLLCEYANKFGIYQNLLEIIVSRIVNSSQAFKYEDDYYIKDLLITAKLDARFAEVFSVTYIKVLNAIEEGKGLSYLYSTIKVIKSEIIQKENYSVYIFHEKFKENLEQLDYVTTSPMILPEKVLLSSENCTNSQLGKYVTKKFDDLLSHPLFEKNKPSTEMIRFMEHQTLRIYAFGQSYCYTILPVPYNLYGIYDPVENYEILDTFGVAEKCCEIVRINENYMDNNKPEIVELDLGTFSFIEAGSSNKMLKVNVTTFNLPIEKINNNRYRVYVDSDLNLEK